ncbi:hypothetical protein RF55_12904 [Lasius niger]|uniref:RNA-directed DNA polymerase n=1 Tax=Lasius niger TaxID=67767 RepID=A0A0J7KBS5_LASNI|nr:hypothetical protein RF55_12904 [Lasius niger]
MPLRKHKKKYAQIDKEAFAIIIEVKKFHQFLYGNRFTLLTDHKPLAQIFNPQKGLPAYSAMRMQHYAVFLQAFNFDIKYRKSSSHRNADGFSRLPVKENRGGEYDVIDVFQLESLETLPVKAKDVRLEALKDKSLNKLLQALEEGKSLVPLGYKDNEFSLQQGIIFRKDRVVIPKTLTNKILKELHAGHFGSVKMKSLSRSFCWWSHMDKEIEDIVKNCKFCHTFSNNPSCKIKHHWETATEPLQRVHVDFAGPFLGYNFLVLVDAYTRWPEVHIMKNITTDSTITKCREIFTTFGLPQVLVSHNGRTFISRKFQKFLESNGIFHKCTAPYHPAINGLAESFVQTFKQALRKLNLIDTDIKINLQLFYYRLTSHQELSKSPAEMMFGRKLRCRLDLLFPKTETKTENVNRNFENVKRFKLGDKVAVREYLDKNVKWRFGIIVEILGHLQYKVQLENGKCWKRHINQMRAIGAEIKEFSKENMFDYVNPNVEHSDNVIASERSSNPQDKEKPQTVSTTSLETSQKEARGSENSEEGKATESEAPTQKSPLESEGRERPVRIRRSPKRCGQYLEHF